MGRECDSRHCLNMTPSPCCSKCYEAHWSTGTYLLFKDCHCSCHSAPEHKESGWEKDFDKRFSTTQIFAHETMSFKAEVKNFIHSFLTSQKTQQSERIRKVVEGLRSSHMDDKAYPHDDCMEVTLYNRALDDLLQTLDTDSF